MPTRERGALAVLCLAPVRIQLDDFSPTFAEHEHPQKQRRALARPYCVHSRRKWLIADAVAAGGAKGRGAGGGSGGGSERQHVTKRRVESDTGVAEG